MSDSEVELGIEDVKKQNNIDGDKFEKLLMVTLMLPWGEGGAREARAPSPPKGKRTRKPVARAARAAVICAVAVLGHPNFAPTLNPPV